jgi:hypothetical protein
VPLAVRFRDPASGIVFGYPVNGETAPGSSGANCKPTPAGGHRQFLRRQAAAEPSLTWCWPRARTCRSKACRWTPVAWSTTPALRQPVPGAVVTLQPVGTCAGWNPATGLVGATLGGYRIDGSRIEMTVGADGFYQYLFGTNAPATAPSH